MWGSKAYRLGFVSWLWSNVVVSGLGTQETAGRSGVWDASAYKSIGSLDFDRFHHHACEHRRCISGPELSFGTTETGLLPTISAAHEFAL